MKKIGILGGTFNPPHYGHLLMANEVLNAMNLDEVWFMPNQEPPHKKKPESVKNEERLHMLELALSGNERFRTETIEWQRTGPSFTFDTMKILTSKFPDFEFFFIIGADMIEYLPKWHQIEELIRLVHFVGVNRPNYRHDSPYPIQFVEIPSMDISSSLIRERLKKGNTVRYLLPDEVIRFIRENHLYGT